VLSDDARCFWITNARARACSYVFHELRSPLHFIMLAATGIRASLEDAIAAAPVVARDAEVSPVVVRARVIGLAPAAFVRLPCRMLMRLSVIAIFDNRAQESAQSALLTISPCIDAVRNARRILDDVLSLSKMVWHMQQLRELQASAPVMP
jgi:hypothetical protein